MASTQDGSSKENAIIDKEKVVEKNAHEVTGISITRAGKTFTASWKNQATYSTLKIKYRLKVGGLFYGAGSNYPKYKEFWDDWKSYTTLATSDTSKAFVTINYGNWYPPDSKLHLFAIEVAVYCDEANKVEWKYESKRVSKKDSKGKTRTVTEWHKYKVTTKYKYQITYKTYDILNPKKPSLSVADGVENTTFTLKVPESNTDGGNITTKITRWTKLIENWGTKDPSTNTSWSNEQSYTSSTGKFSSDTRTFTHSKGTADTPSGKSYTVLAKAIAEGPHGVTAEVYSSIVYAYPNIADNVKASFSTYGSNQYRVTVSWDKDSTSLHPCYYYKVEYYIGAPANSNKAIPTSGFSWSDATGYVKNQSTKAQSASFYTPRIGAEECLWVRVIQKNYQSLETPTNAVLVTSYSKVVKPTINSVSYNAETKALVVDVDNESSLNCTIAVKVDGVQIGSRTGSGTVSVTKDLGAKAHTISAVANYGSVISDTASMTYDPTLSASYPTPYYPTGISGKAIGNGLIKLSWTNVLKASTPSNFHTRITIADNPNEWGYASPNFIQDITIDGVSTSATINGLELGASYYFRLQSTNENGTTGYSSIYGPVKLSAADVPSPNITLQETSDHGIRVSWNWNSWATARGIQIAWSTDRNDRDGSSPTEIIKGLSTGAQTYTISPFNLERGETWYVWAWFTSGTARSNPDEEHILLAISMSAPTNLSLSREAQNTDEEGQTTARLSWRNNTSAENTTSIEVSWSDNPNAWQTTSGASTYSSEEIIGSILIPELALGKMWYARVRTIYNDKHYVWSEIKDINLITKPATPSIAVSKLIVSQYGSIDFSWSYYNEDLSEQSGATVWIYNASNVLVGKATVTNSDKAVTVYCEQMGLVGNQDYHATVQTSSANEESSEVSAAIYFTVVNVPIASITSTSLVDVTLDEGTEEEKVIKELQELPLTVNVGGVPDNGTCIVYVERSATIQLARPDESTIYGYEGELVATVEGINSVTITRDMLHADFTDGGWYRIVAIAINELGTKSEPVSLEFTVNWSEQAFIPEATYVVDEENFIAKITPIPPTGTRETDTLDIYRLSADKPELIVHGGTWGTTYVDPYPALGDTSGHRIVFVTENGDYTTADGNIAWLDCVPPFDQTEQPFLASDEMLINFGSEEVGVLFNLDVTHSWTKDFTETKYLGGSIQGDWNPAVSRKLSAGGVMIKLIEGSDILKMKRLATHTGICHVRTPDGSSFAADIQVTEAWSSDKDFGFAEYTLDITKVDSETLDGMTLEEWEAINGVE